MALAIVSVPGLGTLRTRLSHAAVGWVMAAGVLEVASVLSFVAAFHRAFAPRLAWRSSASLAMVAQGVNAVVPAGGTGGLAAVTLVMARLGIPTRFAVARMVALFVITGVLTNVALVILGGLGVAAGVLPGHAPLTATLLPAVLAGALVAGVAVATRRIPARTDQNLSRWRARAHQVAARVHDGIAWSVQLLRARDPMLVAGSIGFVLFDLVALAAAFRAVGSTGLPLGTMVLSYTLGQVGSVISLPGTTEGGLLGVFVLYGAPLGVTASAIIVYRVAQTLVPLGLGLVGLSGVRQLFGQGVNPEVGDLALEGPLPPS